jgi:hypothetical protein
LIMLSILLKMKMRIIMLWICMIIPMGYE